jgi:hypothetical protein
MADKRTRKQIYDREWVAAKRSANRAAKTLSSSDDSDVEEAPLIDASDESGEVDEVRTDVDDTPCDVDGTPCEVDQMGADLDIWDVAPLSSSEDEDDDEDDEKSVNLSEDLSRWVNAHNITHAAADDLLKVLIQHGHDQLPRSARTMLQTTRHIHIQPISGMDYVYLGFEELLLLHLHKYVANVTDHLHQLELSLNIDGLPLFKSSGTNLWPILCAIHLEPAAVFPVAITSGKSKPTDLDFMNDTLEEMSRLIDNGITFNGKQISVSLRSIVCDAPARAMVLATKLFNGYYGCERCSQKGEWYGRVTYQDTENLVLRTNESFRLQTQKGHHQGLSPLTLLPTMDMVKDVSIDYMHQACLGTMRRLLVTWTSGSRATRLSAGQVAQISEKLVALRPSIPNCFVRKPRGLEELQRWKATELRQFMLYTGKIVLRNILADNLYQHFLSFSVAMCILISPSLVDTHGAYAKGLLTYFVQRGRELYGKEFLVYNVHSMLHIADDGERFRGLDNCSGFPFENYLQLLKKKVRSGRNVIAQVVKRIHEIDHLHLLYKEIPDCVPVAVTPPNNAFILTDTCCEAVSLTNKRDDEGHQQVLCRLYTRCKPLFAEPCDSRILAVHQADPNYTEMKMVSEKLLQRRAILLERGARKSIFIGILHKIV